jgi:hypothetical protein
MRLDCSIQRQVRGFRLTTYLRTDDTVGGNDASDMASGFTKQRQSQGRLSGRSRRPPSGHKQLRTRARPSCPLRPRGCAGACSTSQAPDAALDECDSQRARIGVTAKPRGQSPARSPGGRFPWRYRAWPLRPGEEPRPRTGLPSSRGRAGVSPRSPRWLVLVRCGTVALAWDDDCNDGNATATARIADRPLAWRRERLAQAIRLSADIRCFGASRRPERERRIHRIRRALRDARELGWTAVRDGLVVAA